MNVGSGPAEKCVVMCFCNVTQYGDFFHPHGDLVGDILLNKVCITQGGIQGSGGRVM